MGCSSSNTPVETQPENTPATAQKYPASEAFVINLRNNATTMISLGGGNAVASTEPATAATQVLEALDTPTVKAPPKRIKQLLEVAADETVPTREELEEKLQRAEQRRKELLQLKIENIQKTTQMLMPKEHDDGEDARSLGAGSDETTAASEETTRAISDATTLAYAQEIKAKALDDDSKQELLTTTTITTVATAAPITSATTSATPA